MGIETATLVAVGSLIAGAASTGYSIYTNERQNSKAKKLQRAQARLLAQEEKEALGRRQDLINQQRAQLEGSFLGTDSYRLNQTSERGLNSGNLLG